MTIHQMKLAIVPFEKIVDGEKIIESRLYDEKRQQINPGDQIEFTCNDKPTKKVLTTVRALYHYADFESLFSDFPSTYFGGTSKEELVKEIETFYSKEDQSRYGVVGIKMTLLK
ncbi:MAG: ASCH domain-containing protein [Candidatus Portnoybacteria bacterium]|nr:ASCH domain-containing protein [Candidatus Portnoybacteria bacterium]